MFANSPETQRRALGINPKYFVGVDYNMGFWDDFIEGFEKPFEFVGKLAKDLGPIVGLKKGGKINRTGVYRLHRGERVLNSRQTKAWDKAHRKKKKTGGKKKAGVKKKTGARKKKRTVARRKRR